MSFNAANSINVSKQNITNSF